MKTLVVLALLAFLAAPLSRTADFVSGSQSCPVSGNVQISTTNYQLFQLTVSANISNTGRVYLGSNSVNTSSGGVLVAGASYTAVKPSSAINPQTLYMACTSSADGITWIGSR